MEQLSDSVEQLSDFAKPLSDFAKPLSNLAKQLSDFAKQLSEFAKQLSNILKQLSDSETNYSRDPNIYPISSSTIPVHFASKTGFYSNFSNFEFLHTITAIRIREDRRRVQHVHYLLDTVRSLLNQTNQS